jgi:lipopolysaccharide export system permease protein
MAAIQSCGVGPVSLYRPIGILGALIAMLLVWLSFWAIPGAIARAQEIRASAYRDAQLGMLEPGRFRTFGSGSVVFYAERVDDFGILHNVHVFVDRSGDAGEQGEIEVWVATRAEQRGAGQTDQLFVMYDGHMYQGVPGGGKFRMMQFSEAGFPISVGGIDGGPSKSEMKSTAELLQSRDLRDRAEFQWRVSTPILAIVLMVLAVPLARLRPRQGRFGRIGIAILAYFIYSQLLIASRAWVEGGAIPEYVGLWWVHVLALAIGLWLLARASPPVRARMIGAPA